LNAITINDFNLLLTKIKQNKKIPTNFGLKQKTTKVAKLREPSHEKKTLIKIIDQRIWSKYYTDLVFFEYMISSQI